MRKQTVIKGLEIVKDSLYQQLKFIISQLTIHHENKDEEQYQQFLQQRYAIESSIQMLNYIIKEEADHTLKQVQEVPNDNT